MLGSMFGCATLSGQHSTYDSVVSDYVGGVNKRALEVAALPCPDKNPNRFKVLHELLKLDQDEARIQEYAQYFGYTIRKCDIPELDAWFRTNLSRTSNPFSILSLGSGLARSANAENQKAVQELLYRGDVLPEVRSQVLLATGMKPHERMRWLTNGVAHGKSVPMTFLSAEFMVVLTKSEREAARQALLTAVENNPSGEQAGQVIGILIGQAQADNDSLWDARVIAGLRRIAGNKSASQKARSIANHGVGALERKH